MNYAVRSLNEIHFFVRQIFFQRSDMIYIKQFTILVAVSFIGEILHRLIPFPIPASIYGLVLMFCTLHFKIMPLSKVEVTSKFLLKTMPLFFVPSTVGLIVAWPVIKIYGLQFLFIGIVGTIIVFAVSGLVTQFIIRISRKIREKKN